jgi:hypothetical protein
MRTFFIIKVVSTIMCMGEWVAVTLSRCSGGGLRAAWTTGYVPTHGVTSGLCKDTLRLSRETAELTIIYMHAALRQTLILFELMFKL